MIADEDEFIKIIVQYNLVEIGTNTDSTYLYSFYMAIDWNNPNIVIVNYKKWISYKNF